MNMMKTIGTVVKKTLTTSTGVAAGATVGNYIIKHDACNDEELSFIVGTTSACATTVVVEAVADFVITTAGNVVVKTKEKLSTMVANKRAEEEIEEVNDFFDDKN